MCDRSDFSTENELISHRKLVHNLKSSCKNGVVSLHCAYCNENCKTRTELESHMKNHSQASGLSGKHKCNICDELCPTAALLAEHKLTHCKVVSSANYCTHCKASLQTDTEFYSHLIQHSNAAGSNNNSQISLPYPCIICRQTLISNIEVQMHAQFHTRNSSGTEQLKQCISCLKPIEHLYHNSLLLCKDCLHHNNYNQDGIPVSPNSNNNNNGTGSTVIKHTVNTNFQCIKCPLSFHSELEVQNHLNSNHIPRDNNQHECHLCRNKLSSTYKLQIHLIEHTFAGFGSYTCYLCSSVFTSSHGLYAHMSEHGPSSRPYDCSKCSARYFFRAEMENHALYQHNIPYSNNNQLHQCDYCHIDFNDYSLFLNHMKNVHGGGAYRSVHHNESDNEYIEVGSPSTSATNRVIMNLSNNLNSADTRNPTPISAPSVAHF